MKNIKKLSIVLTGLILFLGGCGANKNQTVKKHKEVKVESSESKTENSSIIKKNEEQISMNDLSSPKMLAAAVIDYAGNAHQEGIWKDSTDAWNQELNSPSKQWTIMKRITNNGVGMETFPTRNIPDAGAADSCPTTYSENGDNIEIWESGKTYNVSKQDLVNYVNGKYKLPNGQNSVNSVAKVKEMANAIEIKDAPQNSSSSSSSQNTKVDTKNLTTQQVDNWVYQAMLKTYYTGDDKPPKDALDFEQDTDDSGCVEILVHENHDSDWMKKRGAQQGVNPTIAFFKVDSQGNLQESTDAGQTWQDTNIPYPGN